MGQDRHLRGHLPGLHGPLPRGGLGQLPGHSLPRRAPGRRVLRGDDQARSQGQGHDRSSRLHGEFHLSRARRGHTQDRHRRQPEEDRARPAVLFRRPGLRPCTTPGRLAQVRPGFRRDHPQHPHGHDPRRPRRGDVQPLGRKRQTVGLPRGKRRRVFHAGGVCEGSGAGPDQPSARSLRSHPHRPRHRGLLHGPHRGWRELRDPRRPQVQDRPSGQNPGAGAASRPCDESGLRSPKPGCAGGHAPGRPARTGQAAR